MELNPIAASIYVLLHLSCLGVFLVGFSLEAAVLLASAFLLRAICVSVIYHRYFAHRSFKTSRPMQFILGLLGTFAVLGGPLWWAQTHRLHHRYADTPADLHSPHHQGFLYSHFGWFLHSRNRTVDYSQVRDLARFPELVALERYNAAIKASYVLLSYGAFGLEGVIWAFVVPSVVVLQMVHFIQSTSHCLGGYRRFMTQDDSRNHWLFGVISLGEGFHNNHHAFPSSARMGFAWWEIDIGYFIIRALERLGLVWQVRTASRRSERSSGFQERYVKQISPRIPYGE